MLLLFPTLSTSACTDKPADQTLIVCFAFEGVADSSKYAELQRAIPTISTYLQSNTTGTAIGEISFLTVDENDGQPLNIVPRTYPASQGCASLLATERQKKSVGKSQAEKEMIHTVVVSLFTKSILKTDIKNLFRQHYVFSLWASGGPVNSKKWIKPFKQLRQRKSVRNFPSSPNDWGTLAHYFTWYVTQVILSDDKTQCYPYDANNALSLPIPPAATPVFLPRQTDAQSTDTLIQKLEKKPFGPPVLQSRDDIQLSPTWTRAQNAVAVRNAIEFLLFEQIGGQIKSAVLITDVSYFTSLSTTARQEKVEILRPCESNRCAAKVLVRSNMPIQAAARGRAIHVLRQREGYMQVYNSKIWGISSQVVVKGTPAVRYWQFEFRYRLRNRPSKIDR